LDLNLRVKKGTKGGLECFFLLSRHDSSRHEHLELILIRQVQPTSEGDQAHSPTQGGFQIQGVVRIEDERPASGQLMTQDGIEEVRGGASGQMKVAIS